MWHDSEEGHRQTFNITVDILPAPIAAQEAVCSNSLSVGTTTIRCGRASGRMHARTCQFRDCQSVKFLGMYSIFVRLMEYVQRPGGDERRNIQFDKVYFTTILVHEIGKDYAW